MFHGIETSGKNLSIWFTDCSLPKFPRLSRNLKTDVCIIGAGIAGLSIAYNLLHEGKSVIILEDGEICSGETGRTTGHLASALDDRFYELEKTFGKKQATLAITSHQRAINWIEEIIQEENIKCDFKRVNGYLFLQSKDKLNLLEKELKAARKIGFPDAEIIHKPNLQGIKLRPAILFSDQAKIHPLKYLSGLAKAIIRRGGKIYQKTHAMEIKPGSISKVTTNEGFIIAANHVVIATNSPIFDKAFLFAKEASYRTYVIGSKIKKGSIEDALFWDTGDPYHYIRTVSIDNNRNDEFVIIGGEDHRTGEKHQANDKFHLLETWARRHISELGKITYHWSGQIMEPVDHLAFIGKYSLKKGNVYVITGDSGNGLTHGTIAGTLISDLILKRKNPFSKIYHPDRKKLMKLPTFVTTGVETVSKYISYFKASEIKHIKQMAKNSGKVINKGKSKYAIYRDANGKFHECTAICPHMKGVLGWNATESTWDCPLHGSRFSPYGDVINGPANQSIKLKKAEVNKEK